jgi:peptide/nickel transport system substrate-binding protein
MGLEAEATGLRPWEDACGEPCVNLARTVFDVLIQQNADGGYEGYLAESIEPNDDFTQWTMVLRPGVTFHNGVPLTAQTIVDMFAIQQTGATSSGQIATYGITGVEAVDELTVLYTLSAPNSAFPAAVHGPDRLRVRARGSSRGSGRVQHQPDRHGPVHDAEP